MWLWPSIILLPSTLKRTFHSFVSEPTVLRGPECFFIPGNGGGVTDGQHGSALPQVHHRGICWQKHSRNYPSISLHFSCHTLTALIESHVCGPGWDGFTGKMAKKSFLFPGRQGVLRVFCFMPMPLPARYLSPVQFNTPLKMCIPSAASRY